MPAKQKISYFDRAEIKRRKARHDELLAKGLNREARYCGPKVIARDYGISVTRVYRILADRRQPYFPCVDWAG